MHNITLDFSNPGLPQVIDVMQSDAQSRFICLTLYDGGVPYSAPSGAQYTVQYRGSGANNMGWYDTIQLSSGTRKAVVVSSSSPNVVTLELAEQALRVNGKVEVSLCVVNSTGYKLNTFPIICRVTGAPYVDPVAVRSYFYVTGLTSEQWLAYVTACQDAQKRAEDAAATFETDPTLSVEGKAADAKATGDAVDKVKEDIDNLSYRINLFDENTIVNGGYYGENGNIIKETEKSQYSAQYIPIKQGATYTWSKNTKLLINTYDDSLQNIERLITYSPTVYTSKVFKNNVKFVRLSTTNDVFGRGLFMFVEGSSLPSSYVSYDRQIAMKTITDLIPALKGKLGYIKETTKTDFNNITEMGYYIIEEINYVNAPTTNSSGLLVVFTGKTNGYQTYQIFSQFKNGRTYIRNQRGTEWGEWSEMTNLKESTLGVNKIAWFGDSISALKDLPSKCANLIGCDIVNCAIPGAVMVQNTESNKQYTAVGFYNLMNCLKSGDYSSVDEAYNTFVADDPSWKYAAHIANYKNLEWNNITTVVVFYGTNDYYHGVITIEEYKRKIEEAFINLMGKYPTIQIYAITPIWRADGNEKNKQNLVLYDYVQAIIDVCAKLNITCYNLYNNSGINIYTKDKLLISDGLHLTDSGAKILSEKLSKFFLSS